MHTFASGHGDVPPAAVLPAADFVMGEWLVEPDLNRVSRNGASVHVRPQLMDLLVYLARNAGRTVRRDELLANVWPDQPFITGTALPRCIAELRHTLGDRASTSTVIQTISKRGYRLIAMVRPAADVKPAARAEASRPPQSHPGPRSGEPVRACLSAARMPRSTNIPPTVSTPVSTSTEQRGQVPLPVSTVAPTTASAPPGGATADHDPRSERHLPAWLLRARQLAAGFLRSLRSRSR